MTKRNSVRVRTAANEILRRLDWAGEEIAELLQAELKDIVSVKTDPYTPSMPGDPPHRKTDELWLSIAAEYDRGDKEVLALSTSEHAVHTELGLKYEPRPWFEPTMKIVEPDVVRILFKQFGE